MKKNITMKWCLLIFSLLSFQSVWASDQVSSKSIFDAMNYQEVLNITLEADFETIKHNRRNDDSHKAVLTFEDEQEKEQTWNIKLKLRGRFRRMNCEMPPLKLDFKKSELEAANLAEFDDIKLVTHCSPNKKEAKNWLEREYLAYKLYQELTPNSYKVQMVRITYMDKKTGKKNKNWGFLIEDTAQLAARMHAEKIDQWGLTASEFHTLDLKVMSLFQYMIGNTDWEIETSRNLKMFKKNGKFIPVPYDFDFSGLVATSYARVDVNYGLKTIKERIYLGFKSSLHDMHDTRAIFMFQKDELNQLISKSKLINLSAKLDINSYLNDFFEHIDNIVVKEIVPNDNVITAQSK